MDIKDFYNKTYPVLALNILPDFNFYEFKYH